MSENEHVPVAELSISQKINLISQYQWGRFGAPDHDPPALQRTPLLSRKQSLHISMFDLNSIAYQFEIERTPLNLLVVYLILVCPWGERHPRKIVENFRLSKMVKVTPYPAKFTCDIVRVMKIIDHGQKRELTDTELTEMHAFGRFCSALFRGCDHRSLTDWLLEFDTSPQAICDWLGPQMSRWQANSGQNLSPRARVRD